MEDPPSDPPAIEWRLEDDTRAHSFIHEVARGEAPGSFAPVLPVGIRLFLLVGRKE